MKRLSAILFGAALTIAAAGVHAETVKVGAVYALTGAGAVGGGDGMRGTELAIEQINAAGGLKNHGGIQVELVKGDTQSKPINAVGETERLINEGKVVLVMGAATSNETLPLSQVAEKYGVPHINTIPQNEAMTNGKLKWTWSATVIDSDYVDGIMNALEMIHQTKPELTRVAVLVPDNEYGIEMGRLLKAELAKRKDLTLTAFIEYGAAAQELLQPALKLKASRPDVVIQVGYFRAGVLASKAYEQFDFHPVVIGTGGMSGDPKLRAELGKLVDGQFAVTPFAGDLPAAIAVSQAFEKKFNQPLTLNSALGYFGTLVALRALDEAKGFTSEDIAASLRQLKIDKSQMIVASDYVAFDENGRNKGRDTVVTQFQGDALVTVWPPEKARAKPEIKKFNTN
ncbi:ABC transporter substrate-binding protein [Xanthobacter dioxanivorans]|uniref:ABC transporter substrate-binding protein n=1 Tax=Xanthobacter dioxanivorans TaxID=2528964 RepID=A0A974SJP5_9HYPH|nr:ABC transporter substrate-binding protein [Xanthobacter dioxanivorans]QRG08651.1 ABC transporter substrate-binding protein [Xanthobacter dioxanivorans]